MLTESQKRWPSDSVHIASVSKKVDALKAAQVFDTHALFRCMHKFSFTYTTNFLEIWTDDAYRASVARRMPGGQTVTKLSMERVVRGHHIYKSLQSPQWKKH